MHRFLVVGVAALAALALSAPAGAWTWPADGAVLRPFALGSDPYAGGQHRGVDVAGPEGSAIRAPAAGTVTFAGSLPTHGRGVTIQTADGYAVTLVHLGTIGVEKGASVDEGSSIGTMGWSGTPEHAVPSVHLGIRVRATPTHTSTRSDSFRPGRLPCRAARRLPRRRLRPRSPDPAAPPAPPAAHRRTHSRTRPVRRRHRRLRRPLRRRPCPPPPGQPAAGAATPAPARRSDRRKPACGLPRSGARVVHGAWSGRPAGQPGLTISATSVPHRRPPWRSTRA